MFPSWSRCAQAYHDILAMSVDHFTYDDAGRMTSLLSGFRPDARYITRAAFERLPIKQMSDRDVARLDGWRGYGNIQYRCGG